MYTGVAQWYRAGGAMTPSELADFYVALTKKVALANSMDRHSDVRDVGSHGR
jgi:hypothetical protein